MVYNIVLFCHIRTYSSIRVEDSKYTGLTNFELIYIIVSISNSISCFNNSGIELTYNTLVAIQGLNLNLVFIFIGFLFKIIAASLYN